MHYGSDQYAPSTDPSLCLCLIPILPALAERMSPILSLDWVIQHAHQSQSHLELDITRAMGSFLELKTLVDASSLVLHYDTSLYWPCISLRLHRGRVQRTLRHCLDKVIGRERLTKRSSVYLCLGRLQAAHWLAVFRLLRPSMPAPSMVPFSDALLHRRGTH